MFDIAFSEMIIVAVIALLVVGPERLPKMARFAGEWIGKLQRYVNDVKADLNRQVELEELRNLQKEVSSAARDIEGSVRDTVQSTQKDFDSLSSSLTGEGGSDTSDAPSIASSTASDWEIRYEQRRVRDRLRDRRVEREKHLGRPRPKRRH